VDRLDIPDQGTRHYRRQKLEDESGQEAAQGSD